MGILTAKEWTTRIYNMEEVEGHRPSVRCVTTQLNEDYVLHCGDKLGR